MPSDVDVQMVIHFQKKKGTIGGFFVELPNFPYAYTFFLSILLREERFVFSESFLFPHRFWPVLDLSPAHKTSVILVKKDHKLEYLLLAKERFANENVP